MAALRWRATPRELTSAGTVATVGNLTTITIPVNVDVPLSINGLTLDAIFAGQIVASVTAVPEPGAVALAGFVLVLLIPFVRRQRTNVFTYSPLRRD